MASPYTCRACSRAILGRSSILSPAQTAPRAQCLPSQARRSLATAAKPPLSVKDAPVAPKRPIKEGNVKPGLRNKLAEQIDKAAPNFTETYKAYGVTQELLQECIKPGEYKIPQAFEKNGEIPTDENGVHLGEGKGWWYETLGLAPTFHNWAQITFIHMYMLQVRFRMFPAQHAPTWIQHITNHLFWAAEDRLVVYHKFNSNAVRQKSLKDMFANWRAVLLSYDEGLVKGDAVLAAAVWRNLFGGREDVDFEKLAQIVAYMRREIRRLTQASDEEVASGSYKFNSDPGADAEFVKRVSPSAQQPIKEEANGSPKKA